LYISFHACESTSNDTMGLSFIYYIHFALLFAVVWSLKKREFVFSLLDTQWYFLLWWHKWNKCDNSQVILLILISPKNLSMSHLSGKFWHFRFFLQSSMWSTGNWLSIFITYFHIDKFRFLLHTTRDRLYYIKWCKNLLNPDNFTQLIIFIS
jgi:hypothetical protein